MDTATDGNVDMDALRTLLTQMDSMVAVQEQKYAALLGTSDNGPITRVLRSLRLDILRGEIAMLSDIAAKMRAAGVA